MNSEQAARSDCDERSHERNRLALQIGRLLATQWLANQQRESQRDQQIKAGANKAE